LTAKSPPSARGETGILHHSSNGFISEAQITCADFRFAKLGRRMRMGNQSVDRRCGARRLNGPSRSLKRRAEQFFTIPALITAVRGLSVSTISPRMLSPGFALICRSARYASIMGIHYSGMDITVAVISTSTSVINFERIYVVAV